MIRRKISQDFVDRNNKTYENSLPNSPRLASFFNELSQDSSDFLTYGYGRLQHWKGGLIGKDPDAGKD